MNLIGIALLGALMNKIRGGLLASLYAKYLVLAYKIPFYLAEKKGEKLFKFFGKHIHHIVFSIVFTLIIAPESITQKIACLISLSISMLAGSSMGWGNYINAMIDGSVDKNRDDAPLADDLFFALAERPKLAGFAALSLRGLLWTFCLTAGLSLLHGLGLNIPLKSFFILPIGLLMGSAYLIAMEICQRIPGMVRGNGWQIGEYFWGFILWGSLALFMGLEC